MAKFENDCGNAVEELCKKGASQIEDGIEADRAKATSIEETCTCAREVTISACELPLKELITQHQIHLINMCMRPIRVELESSRHRTLGSRFVVE